MRRNRKLRHRRETDGPAPFTGAVLLLAAAAPVAALVLAPRPRHDRMLNLLFDSGHAVLFGAVALAVLAFLQRQRVRPRLAYIGAFAIAVGMGLLTELQQRFSSRDADPLDALRNTAGAAAFLALYWVVDRRPATGPRVAAIVGAVAVLVACFLPPARLAAAFVHRDRTFPVLAEFDSLWEGPLVGATGADLEILPRPDEWGGTGRAARLTFHPGSLYPRFVLRAPAKDWSAYDDLVFDVFRDDADTLQVALRIHDERHDETWQDRYRARIEVAPGSRTVRIALADIAAGPAKRTMDVSRIEALALFLVEPETDQVLWLDSIRLERRAPVRTD